MTVCSLLAATGAAACARGEGDGTVQPRVDSPASAGGIASPQRGERPPGPGDRAEERASMVRGSIAAGGVRDARVLAALEKVPRHLFVPEAFQSDAYADRPLPIVGGQTISQPYVVAFMTEAAKPTAESRCLEIGTGSGYQAAVLAELCGETYSIEYLAEVAAFGASNLRRAGGAAAGVVLRVGDGYAGWSEHAPFDVIVVTAAPLTVPKPLLAQLAVGGRLVIPVGGKDETQFLERWRRLRGGAGRDAFEVERLLPVRFVPFLGEHSE